ncbi:MAG: TIGR04372 family glycosyltransferase [Selenomonas ruminantium]|nr:TIGR04372 family glycosyltransferase [Selenomonas ruminantium]
MNKELKDIVSYCQNAKNLLCYGMGDYARMLCEFLECNNVALENFCVSDNQEIVENEFNDGKVCHLSECNSEVGYEVIIALSEKWHSEVMDNLKQLNCSSVLLISDSIAKMLRIWSSICFNAAKLAQIKCDEHEFERKYQELKNKFDHIEVRMGTGATIGALLLEYFYIKKYKCHKEHIFYLYAVHSKEKIRNNTYSYPNNVLYRHFNGENFAAIYGETLQFWKYIITKHSDFININTDYDYMNDVMEAAIDKMHEGNFKNIDGDYFDFNNDEIQYAEKQIDYLGINSEFVCVYSRDAGYYQATWETIDEPLKIMDKYRNSSIKNFIASADYLQSVGVQSVRVGSYPKTSTNESCIIDYAGRAHDDLMDFYLAKKCRFYLGDHSGVILFQALFGTPMAMVNVPNITGYADGTFPFVRERDLIIYHKFWDPKKKRLLNLSEMLEIENCYDDDYHYSGNVRIFEKYNELGIVPIENTEEEILALAKEMEAKLKGESYYTSEDEVLQRKYWDILIPHLKKHKRALWYDARVGRDFLRENAWLTR